jgi:hypothetical protein
VPVELLTFSFPIDHPTGEPAESGEEQ